MEYCYTLWNGRPSEHELKKTDILYTKLRLWHIEMTQQLRALVEFQGLVPSTHMEVYNHHNPSSRRSSILFSVLQALNGYMWYTNVHAGKHSTHKIKINQSLKKLKAGDYVEAESRYLLANEWEPCQNPKQNKNREWIIMVTRFCLGVITMF